MRKLLLGAALLLPFLSHAQMPANSVAIGPGESGYYLLVDSRLKTYPARLKVYQNLLVAKDGQGKTSKWKPEQVYYVRAGAQRYVPAQGFTIKVGLGTQEVERPVFVELLDSGRVALMRYRYPTGNGGVWTAYLLQRASDENATAIPYNQLTGGGKKFREALGPYVAQRPDLQQLLTAGNISIDNFAAFVRALNSGQPFAGPLVKASAASSED
jgi:hypothetical protein